MIQFIGDPNQIDRRRCRHLVVATDECLQWLEVTGATYENERNAWLPAAEPHPDWQAGMPGIVRGQDIDADMPEVFSALNRVQRIPWRINARLAELVKGVFGSGFGVGGLPSAEKPVQHGTDKRAWARHQNRMFRWNSRRRRLALHTYQISTLPERIHWRWRIDFRGRAYPAGKHISPHGADLGRSLIEFAEGEPIGDSARFLAHHGANQWGLSKRSYAVREHWVEENTDRILRSAAEPLGFLWWEQADDPWRFLAFCQEWAGYEANGPDHITHLPCQIDGTCNGFQIVALLMRDAELARMVNLVDGEEPYDLYGAIAKDVTEACRRGDGWGPAWLELLGGQVGRSVVKPACISFGFGASFYSATKATQNWFWSQSFNFPFGGKVAGPCGWLTKQIRDALYARVGSFRVLSDWFQRIAGEVEDLRWVSPVGVPISNNYMKQRHYRIRDRYRATEDTEERDPSKCRRTLMPNFIHSLDAAAMVSTVNRCDFQVSPVHDCWAALAPNMEYLHWAVRDAYVELFAEDQLARLVELLGSPDPRPAYGDLDPESVRTAVYAFT